MNRELCKVCRCATCENKMKGIIATPGCVRCMVCEVSGCTSHAIRSCDSYKKCNEPSAEDPVNHPSHYNTGKIECIDFITDKKLNFCRGNAVKYIVRAGLKDPSKEIEDLKKAIFYINREIQELSNAKMEKYGGTDE